MRLSADSLLTMVNNNNFSYQYTKSKNVYKVDSEAREVRDEATSLRKSIRKLAGYDHESSTRETVEKQLKKFTEEYNTMLQNDGKIDDKTYQKNFDKLKSLVEKNKYKLKKVGFEYDEKSKKYKFDQEKFGKATKKEMTSVFSDENSFMVQADVLVKKIQKAADKKINVTQRQNHNGTIQLEQQQVLAGYAAANNVTVLKTLNSLSQYNSIDANCSDLMNAAIGTFAQQLEFLNMDNSNGDEANLIQDYADLCEQYKEELSKIGIELAKDSNYKTMMVYTDQYWVAADATQIEQYKQLFGGEEGSFGVKAEAISKQIFNKIMKLDTSGIIVDQYV